MVKINACKNATSNSNIDIKRAKGTETPATPTLSRININPIKLGNWKVIELDVNEYKKGYYLLDVDHNHRKGTLKFIKE